MRLLPEALARHAVAMVRDGLEWWEVAATFNRRRWWHAAQLGPWTSDNVRLWIRHQIPDAWKIIEQHRQAQRLAQHRRRLMLARLRVGAPRTRGDCLDGPRPCPWVGCRYHLGLDVSTRGVLLLHRRAPMPWELAETCALDVADRGPLTQPLIAELLGVTAARVCEIEGVALSKLRATLADPDDQ